MGGFFLGGGRVSIPSGFRLDVTCLRLVPSITLSNLVNCHDLILFASYNQLDGIHLPPFAEAVCLSINGTIVKCPPTFPASVRKIQMELQDTATDVQSAWSQPDLPLCGNVDLDVTGAAPSTIKWVVAVKAAAPAVRDLRWCSMTSEFHGLPLVLAGLPATVDRLALDLTHDTLEHRTVLDALRNLATGTCVHWFALTVRSGFDAGPMGWTMYRAATDAAMGAWLTTIGQRSPHLRVTIIDHAPSVLVQRLCVLAFQRSNVPSWSTLLSFCLLKKAIPLDENIRRRPFLPLFSHFFLGEGVADATCALIHALTERPRVKVLFSPTALEFDSAMHDCLVCRMGDMLFRDDTVGSDRAYFRF